MRVAILASSPYSETACATAARLAQIGYVPVGALTLRSWNRGTILRKVGQWGVRDSIQYATAKLAPRAGVSQKPLNPHFEMALRHQDGMFRNLREVGRTYGFPVVTCGNQNSPAAVFKMKRWAPDLAVFAGGSLLQDAALSVARLGVLNSHLALLPEIRGMSSPEWSLLQGVPPGITIHFMDRGIDTGPILIRREFAVPPTCDSLTDLRQRMIAEGIELIAEAVSGLDRGTILPVAQHDREADRQYFVMHDRLKTVAGQKLKAACGRLGSGGRDG